MPDNDKNYRIFKDIAAEVNENSGQAFIMKTEFIQAQTDRPIIDYFNCAREEEYREYLDKCEDFKKEIEYLV